VTFDINQKTLAPHHKQVFVKRKGEMRRFPTRLKAGVPSARFLWIFDREELVTAIVKIIKTLKLN
jgi:hypothetical protein